MAKKREIPVYLFTGFLEAGKTQFIRSTLKDPRFNDGERTLLLLCEQGEEEYEPSAKYMKHVYIQTLENEDDLNPDTLEVLADKYDVEQVMIEYNGMWQLAKLYNSLPENWLLYQQLMFADSTNFAAYNTMFRNLMVDKFAGCELVVFNRVTPDTDKMYLHQMVRAVSRRTQIAYEYKDGKTEYDEIVDPLPFDMDADPIEIEFDDYAMWYRDCADEPDKYDGKRVHLMAKAVEHREVHDGFVFGRKVMTCCEADIQFMGFICENHTETMVNLPGWYDITATVKLKYSKVYRTKGPILIAESITKVDAPKNEVATFY